MSTLLNGPAMLVGKCREPIPKLIARLALSWTTDVNHLGESRLFWIFAASLALLSAATAFIGAVPTRVGGNDDFLLLENAWRTVCGQRPHTDYVSGFGALPFLVLGLGLKLARFSVNGIGYGTAIAGFVIGLWSYYLGKDRLNGFCRTCCGLYVALLVMAPCPPGYWPFLTGHAMWYNRLGYGIVSLVALECLAPTAQRRVWIGGLSTGIAIGLALFLKPSYFLVSLAFVGLSFLSRWSLRRNAGLLLGLVLVGVPMMAYLNFNLAGMVSDYRSIGAVRSAELNIRTPLWAAEKHYIYLIVALGLGWAGSLISNDSRSRGMRLVFTALFVFVADIVILITNSQTEALPLLAIFALIVISISLKYYGQSVVLGGAEAALPYVASIVLFAGVLFVPQLLADATSTGYGVLEKVHPRGSGRRFQEARLKGLLLYDGGEANALANGLSFTTAVNDGVDLLQKFAAPGDRVLAVDSQNPFPYALGWRPPRGGVAGANFNYTINDDHHPSEDVFFGDATVVMVPRRPALANLVLPVIHLYEPGLLRRYRLVTQSDWWSLYRRP